MYTKSKKMIRKRWKFLIIVYFLVCAFSVYQTGVPNIYYLIPIKAIAVPSAWGITRAVFNGFTDGVTKLIDSIEIIITSFILWAIASILIIIVCFILGIDSTPFFDITVRR
ncbi:hypothetical protein Ga0466249_001881 [Sporomusaceae bacterium BoRhaA]|nr:hypothetical protein [Pelorhabdus rhamnosifermentans]